MANKVTSIRVDNKLDLLYEASFIPKNQLVQCAINILWSKVVNNYGDIDLEHLIDLLREFAE